MAGAAARQSLLAAARAVAALGFIFVIFDLRGHAGTLALRDTVTREENLRDVVTAYDVLANRVGVDRSRIPSSVVRQADWNLLSLARALATLARMSEARAVQMNGLGLRLCCAM
jgi:hypothetical protein